MTKHTPWRVKNAGKKGGVKVIDRNGVEVAETMCATDEDYEHARLIAAAPELLAALELVLRRIDNDMVAKHPTAFPGVPSAIAIARLAIAKANQS